MLNKTEVSTLITKLRPHVKRSVVFLVHHNSKEIPKLEKRKGKAAEKCVKKAESLRLQNVFLKQINSKPDETCRYAVMLDFSQRQKLLDDPQLPLETKVMVKVATHKFVASVVEEFRAKHPEWQAKLPDLLKTLGIFSEHKKKVEKQKEKSKRKLERKQRLEESSNADCESIGAVKDKAKRNKIVSEDPDSGEGESEEAAGDEGDSEHDDSGAGDSGSDVSDAGDSEDDVSDVGDSEDDVSEEEDSENVLSDEADNEDVKTKKDNNIGTGEKSKKMTPVASKSTKQDDVKPSGKKKEIRLSSGSAFAEIRRFADLQKEDKLERKPIIESSRLASPEIKNVAVEVDEFFMTGANSFLKTVAVKRRNGEGLPGSSQGQDTGDSPGKNLFGQGEEFCGNRRERRAVMMGKDIRKNKPKKMNWGEESNDSPNSFHKNNKGFKKGESRDISRNQFGNDRKQGSDFIDTRRNFSDDNKKKGGDSKFTKKDFGNRNAGNHGQTDADEKLHPSWEAKRKQKVAIDSFQGKKITFDDGGNTKVMNNKTNTRNVNMGNQDQSKFSDESLHPSWQAKRKQKVAIDSFQGKKIKFDED